MSNAGESFGAALEDALAKLALDSPAQASGRQTNGSAALTAPLKSEQVNEADQAMVEHAGTPKNLIMSCVRKLKVTEKISGSCRSLLKQT